ncbi:hypothetical protein HELRODRAFT_91068 [Helobdella robusta]|uniref:Major facilitator superfamily (MFS) profile domain-containing protein n=1 Tax=Helobdella robusta TaxID=6412 RepID=T1G7Z3_HELRO|nr:hypothetical protein HELRODRAFT_91068 [Helobdella robusta]ESN90066.1 hypothetical protein HELRODRAFT_91068 [Helobdella robusta]
MFLVIGALFAPINRGFSTGYTSPSVTKFVNNGILNVATGDVSLYGNLVFFGGMVGCLIAGPAMDKWGRKDVLFGCAIPQALGWLLIVIFGDYWLAVITSRFFTGVGSAMVYSAYGTYIAETVDSRRRGMMCGVCELCISMGTTAAYFLGIYLNNRYLALVGAALTLALMLGMFSQNETPRWLVGKGYLKEAFRVLNLLREGQSESDPLERVTSTKQCNVYVHASILFKKLKRVQRQLIICLPMMLLQGLCGQTAVSAFMKSIFKFSNMDDRSAEYASVYVGCLRIVTTVIASLTVDRLGRRLLLIVGGTGQAVSLIAMGWAFHIAKMNSSAFLLFAGICCYLACYSFGWGTVPSIILSEMYPQTIRAVASSASTFIGLLAGSLTILFFHPLVTALGESGAFYLFAVDCLAGALYSYFILPETKSKSLESVEESISNRTDEPTDTSAKELAVKYSLIGDTEKESVELLAYSDARDRKCYETLP